MLDQYTERKYPIFFPDLYTHLDPGHTHYILFVSHGVRELAYDHVTHLHLDHAWLTKNEGGDDVMVL